MAQFSPRQVRGARANPRKTAISKNLGRGLVAGVALVVLVIVFAALLTPRGLAQANSNKFDLFSRKADKILQLVSEPNAHDVALGPRVRLHGANQGLLIGDCRLGWEHL